MQQQSLSPPRSRFLLGWVNRQIRAVRQRRLSCSILYAMQLAGGVPAPAPAGRCPVCESPHCELASRLERLR
jgi:hypothetical protein